MSLQEIDLLAAVHPLFDQNDHMLACVAQLIVEVDALPRPSQATQKRRMP